MSDAWLLLNIRREAATFPRTIHVAVHVDNQPSVTAIHEHVQFDTEQKRRVVRFRISNDGELSIMPISPVPSTDTGPQWKGTELSEPIPLRVNLLDVKTDKEYDSVQVKIGSVDDGLEVIAIDG
jgi:hypothetical protein